MTSHDGRTQEPHQPPKPAGPVDADPIVEAAADVAAEAVDNLVTRIGVLTGTSCESIAEAVDVERDARRLLLKEISREAPTVALDLPDDMVDAARMIADRLRDPIDIVDRQLLDEAADLLETFAIDADDNRRRLFNEYYADRELDAAMETVADDPEDDGGGR